MKTILYSLVLYLFFFVSIANARTMLMQGVTLGSAESNPEATIGTTATTDTSNIFAATGHLHSAFQPDQTGNVRYGHAYVSDSNGEEICISIFNSSGTLLASCTDATVVDDTADWANCDYGSEVELQSGQTYYLAIAVADGGGSFVYYRSDESGSMYYDSEVSPCGNSLNTLNETLSHAGRVVTVVWNNTPGDPS